MADNHKRVSKLLTRVPKDVMQIVTAHQEVKKGGCGCRFGFEQALYELIRNAYGVPLTNAGSAKPSTVPAV